MTDLEKRLAEANGVLDNLYAQRVEQLVAERYSSGHELSIQRKLANGELTVESDEFIAYNDYVNKCKAEAKKEVYGDEA